VLLGLGRLHAHKGFDVLIRAVAKLPGVYAVIAGEGPERAALEAGARTAGVADRVHLPGWRTDVGALLAACDVFVSSSRTEPLGNMVLEAWSAGRPVVAAAADGPRELITPRGNLGGEGVLVGIDDADALADGIRAVLDDPARGAAMAAAGRARFDMEFAEAPVLARWRQALAELAAR
jgi:glycosyltransferase involved in cell wall biosynthesis